MIETDVQSRQRLFLMASFMLLMFGSFAVFGIVSRVEERKNFGGSGLEDAAPVPIDRAAQLAQRKRFIEARKAMSESGKIGKWQNAIAAADAFLATTDNTMIRMYRAEALWHAGIRDGSIVIADILKQRGEVSEGEAALLRGDVRAYRRECADLIAGVNFSKATEIELNNASWRCALGVDAVDTAGMESAVRFAERSVAITRNSDSPLIASNLPTYMNTLGGVYLRAQRNKDAIATLLESERLQHEPFNYPFLALAYNNENNPTEAKKWRDRLRKYVTDTYAKREGQTYRHELLLLYREVENSVK